MLIFPMLVLAENPPAKDNFDPSLCLTPLSSYTRIGKSLAVLYQPELLAMLEQIHREIKSDRFEIMDLNHSPVGGAGFWIHPRVLAPSTRFLGIAARINIQLPYFPDSGPGRLTDALDAFGKDLFKILGDALLKMPDNSIKGVIVVLIYSKAELTDPKYFEQAEAGVVYISRESLRKFNSFQLTYQKLFDQSEFYFFHGQDQIQVLLNDFLRG